jgi:hypothetical protein
MKSLEELLIGFCTIPNELLPDVLVVNGLNEYKRGKGPLSQFHYSSILSLLSETAEYIGRRKKTTIMLYVYFKPRSTISKFVPLLDMDVILTISLFR